MPTVRFKKTDPRNQRSCIWPLNKVAAHMNSQGKHFFGANFAMLEAGPFFFERNKKLERRSLFADKLLLIVSILEK